MVHHCQTSLNASASLYPQPATDRPWSLLMVPGACWGHDEMLWGEEFRTDSRNKKHKTYINREVWRHVENVQNKSFVNSVNLMSICNLKCDELWWDTFTSFKVTCRFVCKCWNIFSHTYTVSIVMQIRSIQPLLLFAGSAQSDCRCVRQNMSSRRIWVMDGLSTHKAHHVPMGFWYRWHILMGYDLIASFFSLNVKECGIHAECLSLSLLKQSLANIFGRATENPAGYDNGHGVITTRNIYSRYYFHKKTAPEPKHWNGILFFFRHFSSEDSFNQ